MTLALDMQSAAKQTRPKKKKLLTGFVLQFFAMVAIGLLVYPDASNWFAQIKQRSEISDYEIRVQDTPSQERQEILAAAYSYNDELQPGPLTDPYITQAEDSERGSGLYAAYQEMLRVSGTDAIGTINYPKLDVALPIFHGTGEAAISQGVGHMYGTSLPIGGPSTRSVLTAHSGLPQAELFTPLHSAQLGDEFWISVLGEDHHYRVEKIEIVEPGDTKSFEIIENEDWVTLFTCTPTGVNSNRLLVHAIRTDAPVNETLSSVTGETSLGFPWWALWFTGGSAAVAWLLFASPRKKPHPRKSQKQLLSNA